MAINISYRHTGNNAWFLSYFPDSTHFKYHQYESKEELLEATSQYIKNLLDNKLKTARYIFGVTADSCQADIGTECLAKLGFKKIITCYSSHNVQNQTLTLWVKLKLGNTKQTNEPISTDYGYNCSVEIWPSNLQSPHNNGKRLMISPILRPGYTRILRTPLCYQVNGHQNNKTDWGEILYPPKSEANTNATK